MENISEEDKKPKQTPEYFLRQAFGEDEIAKDNSIYPSARQRTFIYMAMRDFKSSELALKDAEIARLKKAYGHLIKYDGKKELWANRLGEAQVVLVTK